MRTPHAVLGQATVDVEGSRVRAWKVEERRYSDRQIAANVSEPR